jgi:DNA repair exonuclease SbcCD ATPase subunit
MDFGTLTINNFLTIGHAVLDLNDRGLLLVQGQNDVDSSAGSNGAGKSTVPDALCWVAFGVTARGVTGDAVVNNEAKKDCHGEFTTTDSGLEYTIARYRKHSVHKNALIVSQKELSTGVVTDLSKGTDKETQEVVVAILGCTLDVFQGAIYAGQEKMPDLPGMTDKELKTLLEEASGTKVLAQAYQEARQRLLVVKTRSEGVIARLSNEKSRSEAQGVELVTLKGKQQDFNDGRKARATEHLEKIKPINENQKAREARIAELDEPKAEAELAAAKTRLEGHSEQGAKLAALHTGVANAQRAQDKAQSDYGRLVNDLKVAKQGLAEIEDQIGKPCGECGKEYCAHDLETAKVARQKKIDDLAATAPAIRDANTAAGGEFSLATIAYNDFKAGMTDVSGEVATMGALQKVLDEAATLKRNVETDANNIEVHRSNAKRELTAPNPWDEPIKLKDGEIEKTLKSIADIEGEVGKAEEELELYENTVKVFGPGGVRAQILDTVTPFLNEQTREYLGAMSDGNIHAVWSTLTTTSKGELREKFNIEVIHDLGGESFAALSGGEKRKVRLATTMAMQDLVASRASKPLNLFIADEIDHALDANGLERLMAILEKKAKERGTVLVISHNELADWIPNTITVRKVGKGRSTIDGATLAGGY